MGWWEELGTPLTTWEHRGVKGEVKWGGQENGCYIVVLTNLPPNHTASTHGDTLEEAKLMFKELADIIAEEER